jgi:ABC-type uncharacterized transport system permease subunit
MTGSNLDFKGRALYCLRGNLMPYVLGVVATLVIALGFALILSQTMRRIPQNKVCRFAVLFVLCVPLNFVINYIDVRTFGYHQMSWTESFVIALLPAAWGTFLPPQSRKSNTP